MGDGVSTNDDSAMAASSTIIHDERNAEVLFILETMLCMVGMRELARMAEVCIGR